MHQERCLTPAAYAAMVKKDPAALKLVPDLLKTEQMCRDACRRNGSVLAFVPPDLHTNAVCLAAVLGGLPLAAMKPEDRTAPVCLAAVSRSPLELEAVPPRWCTPELCLAAVQACPDAVRFVPGAARTGLDRRLGQAPATLKGALPEIFADAVRQKAALLALVPDSIMAARPEIAAEATARCPELFRFVPYAAKSRVRELAAALLDREPTDPAEEAAEAFALAASAAVQRRISFTLQARRRREGGFALCIGVKDPDECFWPRGSEPSAAIALGPDKAPNLHLALLAFADSMKSGADLLQCTMPPGMRRDCIPAIRSAAEAAGAAEKVQSGLNAEMEEDAGPRP